MKEKTFFRLFMIIFLFCAVQTAFCEELLSEQTSQIEENKTEITIRCSVPGVYIFLNGELQGKTELTIRNLREGIYNLKLEKKGFLCYNIFNNIGIEILKRQDSRKENR